MTTDADKQTNRPPESSSNDSITPVTDETRAMVERQMPHESDEVKQKFGELIDAIKKQATTEMESAGELSRETYVEAVERAKMTLQRAQGFFQEQEAALEKTARDMQNEATQTWETFLANLTSMGNRLDRAINNAWSILTEPEDTQKDEDPPAQS